MTDSTYFTLTFPGAPVTRSLTLDDMRARLRANGWRHVGTAEGDAESERWEIEGDHLSFYTSSHDAGAGSVACAVALLALRANVTAGEMLARIAQQPDAAVLAEREACAKLADEMRAGYSARGLSSEALTCMMLAEDIRARGAMGALSPEQVERDACLGDIEHEISANGSGSREGIALHAAAARIMRRARGAK